MSYCFNPNCPKPDDPLNAGQLVCRQCGTELLLQNRYRGIQKLGEGGFGLTIEVEDGNSRKVVKILLINYPKAVKLFQQEAAVLSRLNHPGIPKVEPNGGYFTLEIKGNRNRLHCLVMEKIDGCNLEDWLKHNQPITQERAIDWLKQLLEILDNLHQQRYFHRDIKPENIMIKADNQLVLIDFGTAREITSTYLVKIDQAENITQVGTAGYMPLEQLEGGALPQSDFFALGRTFVYLLTGKHPSQLMDYQTGLLLWRDSAPQITPQLADLIDDLMALLPGNRPANTQVILQRLAQINDDNFQPVSPPDFQGNQPPKNQRNTIDLSRYIKVNVTLGFSLFVALGSLWFFRPQIAVIANNIGLESYKSNQFNLALFFYKIATILNPENKTVHNNLGLFYERQNRLDKASKEYSIAMQGQLPEAYNNRGRLHIIYDKNYPAAIQLFFQGLQLKADTETQYNLHRNLSWALLKQNRYPEAKTYIQKTIKLDSDKAAGYCLMAQVLEAEANQPHSLQQWQNCLKYKFNPQNPEINQWRKLASQRLESQASLSILELKK